jgi:hypothetical protein
MAFMYSLPDDADADPPAAGKRGGWGGRRGCGARARVRKRTGACAVLARAPLPGCGDAL